MDELTKEQQEQRRALMASLLDQLRIRLDELDDVRALARLNQDFFEDGMRIVLEFRVHDLEPGHPVLDEIQRLHWEGMALAHEKLLEYGIETDADYQAAFGKLQ